MAVAAKTAGAGGAADMMTAAANPKAAGGTPAPEEQPENPKDVFRSLGCYICRMSADKKAAVPSKFSLSPDREPQSEEEFKAVYDAKRWSVLPLKISRLLMFDQDSGTVHPALARYFNRARRKYVSKYDSIESRHGFLDVVDATHEWCVEFAKRFHKQISGLEIYAEKHWMSYAGKFDNPGDPDMQTGWYDVQKGSDPVIKVRKEELEDVFGRLVPHASAGALEAARRRKSGNRVPLRVAAGEGGRHMALIGLAFDVYAKMFVERKHSGSDKNGLITQQMMYDRIMSDGRSRIEAVNEYENGAKRDELNDIIDYVLRQYDGDGTNPPTDKSPQQLSLAMGKDVISDSLTCAHIVNTAEKNIQGRDMYNCWYWDKKRKTWNPNTEYEIMSLLMTLQSDTLVPDSRMSRRITEALAASEDTLRVDTESPKYLDWMKHVIINTHGEYFDLRDGGVRRLNPETTFFERPHMRIKFTGGGSDDENDSDTAGDQPQQQDGMAGDDPMELDTTAEPTKVFRCMDLWFSKRDKEILLDHLAGALLHTSLLGDKPKILYVVGRHGTFKSLWVALMSCIMHPSVVSSVSAAEMSDKFGMSMIAERILNMKEEQDAVRVDSPGALKDAVTRRDGPVTQKYAISQVYASRFPRHLIMCNMVQPIAQNDEDDSIFVRTQYITTRDKWDSVADEDEARNTKWYAEIINDEEEVRRFALWIMHRAHEILNKKHELNVMSVDESREAYHKLMHGTFEEFVKTTYMRNDVSVGVVWRRIFLDYRKATRSNVDYKKFKDVLVEAGFESVRGRVYRTDVKDVFSFVYTEWHEAQGIDKSDAIQVTIIPGLRPSGPEPACLGGDGGAPPPGTTPGAPDASAPMPTPPSA